MDKLLSILIDNPRLTNAQLASMVDMTEAEVGAKIAEYEKKGIICGYKTVINWEKLETTEKVTALIELKVTPRKNTGFEAIAEEIMAFDQVESVTLMSGGFDFSVRVTGQTFQGVAMFVAKCLAPIDSVVSTATHFVLKKYKEDGIVISKSIEDERGADIL